MPSRAKDAVVPVGPFTSLASKQGSRKKRGQAPFCQKKHRENEGTPKNQKKVQAVSTCVDVYTVISKIKNIQFMIHDQS